MKFPAIAAFALISASSIQAQTALTTAQRDFTYATPIGGNWSYAATSDGSEATFLNAASQPQLIVHCTRATRRVSIAKPAIAGAPFLLIWTTTQTRNAPASFNPATSRLTADFAGFDPLLDALSFSHGRIAFSVTGTPPLVLPPWPEIARVVEDCRS
jgi:hypothetical protein